MPTEPEKEPMPAGSLQAKPRIVLDTNVIVSAILFKGQAIRSVLTRALNDHCVVFSQATWDELATVLQRSGFDKTMPLGSRLLVLAELATRVEIVAVTSVVSDCRDPKDNKFLALALDAGAGMIVTGDADLLALHPLRGVRICLPAGF